MIIDDISNFIKRKNIEKVVIHGLYNSTHTHRFIHEAIYDAFSCIIDEIGDNIKLYWIDDCESNYNFYQDEYNYLVFSSPHYNTEEYLPIRDNIYYILHYRTHNIIQNKIVNKYNNLLQNKRAVKYVEYRGPPNKHYNEELSLKIDKKKYFWYYYYVPVKDAINDLDDKRKKNYTFQYYPTNELHIPWATNILPKQIEKNIIKMKSINYLPQSYFCGTLWSTNEIELKEWKKNCISHRLNSIFDHEKNEEKHQKKVISSLLAPAIQGASQRESETWFYFPCRFFKNVSYGGVPITNNPGINKFFKDYFIIYDENIDRLFYKSLEYRKWEKINKDLHIKSMEHIMNYIKDNHTYLNRIHDLIQYGLE